MSRPTQEQEAMNERDAMAGFEEWYYDTSNGMHIGTVVMSQRDAAARGWQAARRQDAETLNERDDNVDKAFQEHVKTSVKCSERMTFIYGWQAARRQDAETIKRLTRERDEMYREYYLESACRAIDQAMKTKGE